MAWPATGGESPFTRQALQKLAAGFSPTFLALGILEAVAGHFSRAMVAVFIKEERRPLPTMVTPGTRT